MGKVSVDEFRARENPLRRSKLEPFRDEILELYKEGYSLDQVIAFLALNDVQVAKSTLHGFIKRRIKIEKMNFPPISENNIKKTPFKKFTLPSWANPGTKIDDLI